VLRSIYFAKFQLVLRYGIIFEREESNSIKVLRIQRRVLRIIRSIAWESCRDKFLRTIILTVTFCSSLRCCVIFKNIISNWTLNLNYHYYNMRRKWYFLVQICNKQIFKKSVIIMKIKLYNEVRNRIKNWKVLVFKVELKFFYRIILFIQWMSFFVLIKVNEIARDKSINKF